MNEAGTTDRDDLFLCPVCSGVSRWATWECDTCNGSGFVTRATMDERRQDAKANDEQWKDGE